MRPDLIVLDLMMPSVDGWEVCRRLRKESNVPVIMLTARTDDVDKIVGLELGADDYVTKPFNPRELVARVKAVLRAAPRTLPTRTSPWTWGHPHRPRGGEVTVGGRPVQLQAKEFDLLVALAQEEGRVLTREALLEPVWGYEYFGDSRTVDVHVTWLRDKLSGSTAQIQTVRGLGYKLVAPPEPAPHGRGPSRPVVPAPEDMSGAALGGPPGRPPHAAGHLRQPQLPPPDRLRPGDPGHPALRRGGRGMADPGVSAAPGGRPVR